AGRQRNAASNEAISRALQITDANAWDQAMASGGLAALGIRPDQITSDALNTILGRRDELADNRAADLIDARRGQEITVSGYNFDRSRLKDEREDEQRAINDEANRLVDGLLRGTVSREEASRNLANTPNLDWRTRDAA